MNRKITVTILMLMVLTTKAISQNNCDTVLLEKGKGCLERKSFDSAIVIFNKVLEKCPTFTTAYLNRGICYLYKKEEKNAVQDFERSIVVAKAKFKMTMFIADTYFRFEKYDDAYEYYQKAIKFSAIEADPFFKMGRCLWLGRIPVLVEKYKGDYNQDPEYASHLKKDILILFDKATSLDSTFSYEYFYYKGMFYSNFGDWKAALTNYERSLEIHPIISTYKYCAECCKSLQLNQKACDYINQWATLYSPFEEMNAFQKQEYAKQFCADLGIK